MPDFSTALEKLVDDFATASRAAEKVMTWARKRFCAGETSFSETRAEIEESIASVLEIAEHVRRELAVMQSISDTENG